MSHLSNVWFKVTDLQVASGRGCRVTTADGQEYLDFAAGIAVNSTGHCHPRVVRAIAEQAERFIHAQANVFTHDLLEPLAAKLAELAPGAIDTFFFANSGAEITEAAVKLAKQVTKRPNTIVFSGSFHGRTHLAMAMTTSKTVYRAGHAPLPGGVYVAPFPDPLAPDPATAVDEALRGLDHLLLAETAPSETAAMILEPVLGEGGYIPAPRAFLDGVVERCRAHGILFIADEVQSGFGRTGQDVRRRSLRHRARHHLHGQGHRIRVPVLGARNTSRARRSVADGQPRRHVRWQSDRVRGRAGDDRGDERAGVPRKRARPRRAVVRCAARPSGVASRPAPGARTRADGGERILRRSVTGAGDHRPLSRARAT